MAGIEETSKKLLKFQQSKGQLLASIEKVEEHLDSQDFKDFCDYIYSAVAHIDTIIKKIKNPDKEETTS